MTDPQLDHAVQQLTLGLLVDTYGLLRQAWWASLRVQECADDAPWNTWHDDDDPRGEARDLLVRAGEHSAIMTGQAITRHLGLLSRAYGPDPAVPEDGPDADRWPHSAVYPQARAIAEGTALFAWLLDAGADRAERVLRGARLTLWSNAGKWADDVEAAGLEVRRDPRPEGRQGPPYVWAGEGSGPLTPGNVVKIVHGRRASDDSQRWGKMLHNDPGVLGPRSTLRIGETGAHLGSQVREDEHLELARDITALLRTAGQRQAAYWGRSAAELVEACDRATASVGDVLPDVAAHVKERHALLYEG